MGHGKAVRGKKRWGGEEEETAGRANGGKGTERKRRCGESSGMEQEGEGCGTAGRGGAERVGGMSRRKR